MKVLLISAAKLRIAFCGTWNLQHCPAICSWILRHKKDLARCWTHTERIDFNSTTAAFRLYMLLSQKMKTFPFFSKINATISYVVESCLFFIVLVCNIIVHEKKHHVLQCLEIRRFICYIADHRSIFFWFFIFGINYCTTLFMITEDNV